MQYEFDWGMLLRSPYFGWIVEGVLTTFHLALLSWVLALTLGIVIGIFRVTNSRALRVIGTAYVELFRNIPLIVQLFLWLYVAPQLLPTETRLWWNRLDYVPYWTAVIGISFYTASRVAEQIRSAILAIPPGQFKAALSTGLTTTQTYRFVIVPYALRIILPALTSEFLTIFKNTALALTIGVVEITATTRKIEAWSFRGIEAYTVASLTYAATTILVVVFMSWLERRYYIPGLIRREREAA
ncbi:amino acid ABC transporter permease [Bosea sp. BK604]|uniref:amino acid ABC transporter permease n=1 Tax=Bosea sp. BK604 TaxID=2512180 RepID=UPI001042D481|nr:amino acid ABC transporter permease [Bosea sp. BK604]TCR63076.1 glutamate/aspartate transport system permease protein [Bosea sp. BK604]